MGFPVFLTGLAMGLSLILAIGAQNAFVLRQGLRGEHVLAVCLICAVSDALLIVLGVAGFGRIAAALPWIEPAMRLGGAAFLIWYGTLSLRRALRSNAVLDVGGSDSGKGGRGGKALAATMLTALALTWLNPHVYLDTVVLLGTISTQFPGAEHIFAAGAVSASFLFFFSLGYGASRLRPVFARPAAWRLLEGAIALVMWAIAAKLLLGG